MDRMKRKDGITIGPLRLLGTSLISAIFESRCASALATEPPYWTGGTPSTEY